MMLVRLVHFHTCQDFCRTPTAHLHSPVEKLGIFVARLYAHHVEGDTVFYRICPLSSAVLSGTIVRVVANLVVTGDA